MQNEKGFTLIEMLIVLLIISILILVTIPNVTKHFGTIDDKGCDAYLAMVQGQVQTYKIDHNKYPTIEELKHPDYLNTTEVACPNGEAIAISARGEVVVAGAQPEANP